MSNATQENAPEPTDTPAVRPIEGHAQVISRRPSWADKTTMAAEVITHSWTAPTVAKVLGWDGGPYDAAVEICREEDLLEHGGVVALHEGAWRIFVLDTAIGDIVNARKLAAAIIECCDRIEGDQHS